MKKGEKEKKTVEQLILDQTEGKYQLVDLATRWAKEIKKRENRPEMPQEILYMSLEEIFTGKVSLKEIEALPPIPIAKQELKNPIKDPKEKQNSKESKGKYGKKKEK